MNVRRATLGFVLLGALGLSACGHPEQRVVDQYFGAVLLQEHGHVVRLLVGVHDQRPTTEKRTRVEPAQVLAEIDDAPDDQQRGADRLLFDRAREFRQRARDGALRRERALKDDRRRLVR